MSTIQRERWRTTISKQVKAFKPMAERSEQRRMLGMIFAHNHPSGAPEPSAADHTLTQALKQALGLVDIRVLDHFVVAGRHIYSFAEHGHM